MAQPRKCNTSRLLLSRNILLDGSWAAVYWVEADIDFAKIRGHKRILAGASGAPSTCWKEVPVKLCEILVKYYVSLQVKC